VKDNETMEAQTAESLEPTPEVIDGLRTKFPKNAL
jgi:hypothetical protein